MIILWFSSYFLCYFSLRFGIGFRRHLGSCWELLWSFRWSTRDQQLMNAKKLGSKKVGSEEGRSELALSERGPRRGERGEVNLPLGYGGLEHSSENGRQD